MRGGEEHVGWDQGRFMLADLIDAVNQNTRACGNFKKPPKFQPFPRPKLAPQSIGKSRAQRGRSKVSVADLYGRYAQVAADSTNAL